MHTKKSASEKCENGRKVILYKQKGSEQKPRDDTKIGTDIAQPNGPDSMWSINTNKSGKFYAKAPKKPGCAAVSATRSTRSRPTESTERGRRAERGRRRGARPRGVRSATSRAASSAW